jgi:hypothetical protein
MVEQACARALVAWVVFLMQNGAMRVAVARSRAKSTACLLGCALFVAASLAIIAEGSALTLIVGAVGVLTFVGFGIGWIVVLLRAGPGLVVDETGFDDTSSITAVGRVLWADVTTVSQLSISWTSFVVIGVRDPELYLTRLRGLPRFAAIANNRLFGSPVTISAVSLKISFANLSTLLAEGLRKYHEPWLEIPT